MNSYILSSFFVSLCYLYLLLFSITSYHNSLPPTLFYLYISYTSFTTIVCKFINRDTDMYRKIAVSNYKNMLYHVVSHTNLEANPRSRTWFLQIHIQHWFMWCCILIISWGSHSIQLTFNAIKIRSNTNYLAMQERNHKNSKLNLKITSKNQKQETQFLIDWKFNLNFWKLRNF